MIDLTFRIIYFPKQDQYIGVAWNYDSTPPVFETTAACPTYTDARNELELEVRNDLSLDIRLRYFDGEYECGADGLLYPRTTIKGN